MKLSKYLREYVYLKSMLLKDYTKCVDLTFNHLTSVELLCDIGS